MKRRDFVTSLIASLATLPFLGWLKPKEGTMWGNGCVSWPTRMTVDEIKFAIKILGDMKVTPFREAYTNRKYYAFSEKGYCYPTDKIYLDSPPQNNLY